MSPSKIFLFLNLSFVFGIAFSSFIIFPSLTVLSFLIVSLIIISTLWIYPQARILGLCLLFLAAGIFRIEKAFQADSHLQLPLLAGKDLKIGGKVIDADYSFKSGKLVLESYWVENDNERIGLDRERIAIYTDLYPKYTVGALIELKGRLQIPREEFAGYFKKDQILTIISFPEIELVSLGKSFSLKESLVRLKNNFKKSSAQFFSPPQRGLAEALFFGDEDYISPELKQRLNDTGTRHIAAVSGMNISIIASMIMFFAMKLGLWRRQALFLSLAIIIFYILMIGAPSSAVRAGIMGSLIIIAQYGGRISGSPRTLVLAASAMLLFNPRLFRYDIGFQLSFMATLGIIIFYPLLRQRLKFIPWYAREPLGVTASAYLFTLPVLLYNFGQISLVSLIGNIIIAPLIAPITFLIFFFGVTAMLLQFLAWPLAWVLWLGLTFIITVINWLAAFPLASLSLKHIHWYYVPLCYVLLFLWYRSWKIRSQLPFL